METKIISIKHLCRLYNNRLSTYFLRDIAWSFADALLWRELTLPEEEITLAKSQILHLFKNAPHRKKAIIAFCERIILADKYRVAHPNTEIPMPCVWFNPSYHHGFAETKSWYEYIQFQRTKIPGYLKHISIMANHYFMYALNPSPALFQNCRKKLLALNAKSLLQQFYNAIAQLNNPND